MIDPQILEYTRQQSIAGVSIEEIRKSLLSTGWQEGDINDALSQTNNSPHATIGSIGANRGLNKKLLILILAGILIIGGSALGYFYYANNKAVVISPTPTETPSPTSSPTATETPPSATPLPTVIKQQTSEKITGQPFVDNMPNGLPSNFSSAGINNLKIAMVGSIRVSLLVYANKNDTDSANDTKYPTKLSSVFGGGATPLDPVTKKPFEYTVASDGKDYTLCVELQTGVKTCGHQNTDWSIYFIKQ